MIHTLSQFQEKKLSEEFSCARWLPPEVLSGNDYNSSADVYVSCEQLLNLSKKVIQWCQIALRVSEEMQPLEAIS